MANIEQFQSTERFSDRVADYIKYRPGYPAESLTILQERTGLAPHHTIVDVGSGTGILSKLFLDFGNAVLAIEPNREMAEAAQFFLVDFDGFQQADAMAEATGLANNSADFIVAGQAFHWFDVQRTCREFRRILKPGGWCVLIWNERRTDSTAFLRGYESFLLEWSIDYADVSSHYQDPVALEQLYGEDAWERESLDNHQSFDFDGLRGRVMSCSYIPAPEHPRHVPMLAALQELFDLHQRQGLVRMDYDTQVYFGQLPIISKAGNQ